MRFTSSTKESHVNIDILIEKYHDGELEDHEIETLNNWLLASPENQTYFLQAGNIRAEIAHTLSAENDSNNKTARLRGQLRRKNTPPRARKNRLHSITWPVISIAALLLCAFTLYLFSTHSQHIPTRAPTIHSASGTCLILQTDNENSAEVHYQLQQNDVLKTADTSQLLLIDQDHNQWQLTENTSVTYRGNTLTVHNGTVNASINPNHQQITNLGTEHCMIHVTGTQFSVSNNTSHSTVAVSTGTVRVEHNNLERIHISAGHSLQVNKHGIIYTSMTGWATGFTLTDPKNGAIIPIYDPLQEGVEVSLSKHGLSTISVNTNLNQEVEHLIDRVDLFINEKLLKVFILKENLWDMEMIKNIRLNKIGHTHGQTQIKAVPYFNKTPGHAFITTILIVE